MSHLPFVLGQLDAELHFAGVIDTLDLVLLGLNDKVLGDGGGIGKRLEVAEHLWSVLLVYLINLSILSVVEEDVVAAAVDSLDVHTELHDDLEVLVLLLCIPHADLYLLIGGLDHLELVLHLLLEHSVAENNGALFMQTGKGLVVTAPGDLVNLETSVGSLARHAFPSLRFSRRLRAKLPLLPHDDEAVLGAATDDPSSLVELDGDDLVVDHLSFESGICK